ncbi:MAG: O-antigen ligase family protein, partial [Patescibacteria group bacterium]
ISTETHPYPHNLFLAIWTELGIFGLIVFLFILFQFFKSGLQKLKIENLKTIKNNNLLIISILSAMVTILIHGLVDTPYFKNDLSVLFWLIVGLIMMNKKNDCG